MPRTPNGIRWALRELALRAGALEIEPLEGEDAPSILADGIAIRYGEPREEAIAPAPTIAPAPDHPTIWICPCAADAPSALLDLPIGTLPSFAPAEIMPPGPEHESEAEVFDAGERIRFPLLAAGPPGVVAMPVPGGAVLRADIAACALMFLSRWEETVSSARDEHGRFPAGASIALRHGFLDRPIVDEHALVLRAWMRAVRHGWTPSGRAFDVRLSHDIDRIRPFRGPRAATRRFAGDVLRRRDPGAALRTLGDAWAQTFAPERTSSFKGIEELGAIAVAAEVPAAFLFQAGDPGPFDSDYDVRRPPLPGVIRRLVEAGHTVGLHPSYSAAEDPARLARERDRLAAVSPAPVIISRHHYLRFSAPETWRALEAAGITCDMSLGYAGHEGFRAGTCHPYQPFDLQRDTAFDLLEEPLIAMESTLLDHRDLGPEATIERVIFLAERCRRVGGRMTLLWHNSKLHGGWEAWGECYRAIVPALAGMVEGRR